MHCRIRSAACDTVPRLCVRPVLWPPGFLSIPALPSSDSAGARAPSFAAFSGTTPGSDFFASYIIGFGSPPSLCGPGDDPPGQREDLPGPDAGRTCVP